MSGLLDQAGLTAGSGLSNGAGLYKWGNFNPFDPTDLDPYLLFDTAAGSMIGTLENPTLDLDPSNQETLDVITATRAGVATYIDANGLIATAIADTVRVDYVDSVPMILVEPSATNLVTYSEDFSNISYEKTRVAITTDDSISPDGNTSADKLSATATTGTHFLKIDRTVTSGAAYTFSVFVKKGEYDWVNVMLQGTGWTNSTKSINFNASTGEFGTVTFGVTHTSERLANGWYRLSITNTTVSTSVALRLYGAFDDNVLSYTGDGTSGVYIWGAQLETGSVATSLIPTSGGNAAARTRASDDLVITGSAFSSFFNTGGDGTFFVTAQIKNPEGQHATLRGGSNSQLYVYSNADAQYFAYDGGSNVNSYGDVTENQLTNFAVSYNSSNFTVSKDGSSDSSLSTTGNLSNATRLEIGTGYSTGFCGHFRRIIYWPYSSDRL
jgi:hypothetical protein